MTDLVPSSATLVVRLFGRLEVEVSGTPVTFAGRHAQALIALLVLLPRPRLRDAIAAELWPDFDGPSGSALRQALWLARSNLVAAGIAPERILEAGQDTLGLRPDVRIDSDVAAFETLAASGPRAAARAVDLYRGDLVERLGHECFATERERLADLYEDALAAAAETALTDNDVTAARRFAAMLIARDPIREEAHAVLISAYGRVGTRSQVVRQYRRLCVVLRTELAVAPLPETDAAYREAVARTVSRSANRAAAMGPSPRLDRPRLAGALATSA
jgi:DNA-binding SARP family transcriptional activator